MLPALGVLKELDVLGIPCEFAALGILGVHGVFEAPQPARGRSPKYTALLPHNPPAAYAMRKKRLEPNLPLVRDAGTASV